MLLGLAIWIRVEFFTSNEIKYMQKAATITPLASLQDASKSHWSQLKRKGEQGISMTFPGPQNSAFLSSGRASKTQAIATQTEKWGIFVVLWLLILLPCSCFHASLKITWRFAWLAVAIFDWLKKGQVAIWEWKMTKIWEEKTKM